MNLDINAYNDAWKDAYMIWQFNQILYKMNIRDDYFMHSTVHYATLDVRKKR